MPVVRDEDTVDVAFATFEDLLMVDELQLLTGLTIRPLIAPLLVVDAIIETFFRVARASFINSMEGYAAESAEEANGGNEDCDDQSHEILDLNLPPPPGSDGRIVHLVNQILEQALRTKASDIHIEPFEDPCHPPARVDGVLREPIPPPRSQFVSIVSRFKILAKMDIAEKRVPQDGAIALKSGDKRVDSRVSTVPTVYGEKMVMRILDKGAIPIELTGLGFDERQSKDLVESIQMPHGLMLVTGPTGSGKSTTLYACLNRLNEPDTNICTVKTPEKTSSPGSTSVQVKTQVGLTFAALVRFLAADRTSSWWVKCARRAPRRSPCAALTGHFVLSRSHQRFPLGRQSFGRLGHCPILAGVHAGRTGGPAIGAPPLPAVQRAL